MKFSLDKVWKLCLWMWDGIFDLPGDVNENKANWIEENGFKGVLNDCFFCQYAQEEYLKEENHGIMCDFCPVVQIDPKFDCAQPEYNYVNKPKEFRRRLHQLDKKRLGNRV